MDYANAPAANAQSRKTTRALTALNNFLQWTSALIVGGIVSWFIKAYDGGEHIIYWEVISWINVAFFLPALFAPVIGRYKGWYAPLHFIFSYLWLTGFVFAAQDYSWRTCHQSSPAGVGHCSLKWSIEAFSFLAFFFNVTGTLLEARIWDRNRFKTLAATRPVEKNVARPSGETV